MRFVLVLWTCPRDFGDQWHVVLERVWDVAARRRTLPREANGARGCLLVEDKLGHKGAPCDPSL